MSIQPRELPRAPTSGRIEGFDDFYRREFPRAAQLAWLLTHGQNNEDLAQDAFMSVQARYASLDNPSAYLTAAVVNRCRSWHRREQRRRLLLTSVPSQNDQAAGPSDYLIDAIGALPYRQRVVVVARYWAGWTETEIADALGCRPGTREVIGVAGARSPAQGGRTMKNSPETLDDFEERIRAALSLDAGRVPLSGVAAPARRARRRTWIRRPHVRAGLGIAATATAVVAVLGATSLLPDGSAGGPGPSGVGSRPAVGQSVPRADVATFLHNAAQAVLHRSNPAPRPDQFIYTESFNRYSVMIGDDVTPPVPPRIEVTDRRIWLSVDGTRDGVLHTRLRAPSGRWDTTPLPACSVERKGSATNRDCPAIAAYQSKLPTKPDAMLLYLNSISGGETHAPGEPKRPTNPRLFSSAVDLLREQMMPAAAQAALYEAMAKIPGLTIVRGATDILGRPAIGIGIVDKLGARLELLFNSQHVIVGERWLYKGKPVAEGSAILRTAIVDKPGQLP